MSTDKTLVAIESLDGYAEVELFKIDLLPVGINQQFYFTQADALGRNVKFGGHTYTNRPIKVTGFEKSANSAPPEPILAMSNVDNGANALLTQYDDLLGAEVTRTITYTKFLDFLEDGVTANPSADANAKLFPEIWEVEQKQLATMLEVQWRLRARSDLTGKMLPGRAVLKNVCQRRYRVWNATSSSWTYHTINACPYTGSAMFDRTGSSTANPLLDACSKDLRGCAARYPGEDLPGWFFPGVGRVPVR